MIRYLLTIFMSLWVSSALAQDCTKTHVVGNNETIFDIAQRYFGDPQKWSVIYYGNQGKLNGALLQFAPGTELNIPCLHRNWLGQGMVTELVNAALENTPHPVPYAITWDDNWSTHLFPQLDGKKFDMGFPWLRPNCEEDRENERCANCHFSDPLVELLILVFTRTDNAFAFESDEDIHGKTLCRPEGYFTHDLDRAGREWLKKGLITLVQAANPDAYFELLMKGEVDGVTLNEFLGWTKINDLGLKGAVEPLRRPLSIEGLHVLISKKHWRSTTHLYQFNAGLEELKKSNRYDEIVSKHLSLFWSTLE